MAEKSEEISIPGIWLVGSRVSGLFARTVTGENETSSKESNSKYHQSGVVCDEIVLEHHMCLQPGCHSTRMRMHIYIPWNRMKVSR